MTRPIPDTVIPYRVHGSAWPVRYQPVTVEACGAPPRDPLELPPVLQTLEEVNRGR